MHSVVSISLLTGLWLAEEAAKKTGTPG